MKVLLIGTSFSAMPMLFDLKKRGADVTAIGKLPEDPCHLYANQSIYEDYSDRQVLLDVCRKNRFDFIVPTCNDYSYVAAAYVAGVLGFPGFDDPETTEILHTKNHFRRFCAQNEVPAPIVVGEVSADVSESAIEYDGALLVKPVDSFSGRGVEVVLERNQLQAAIARALSMSRRRLAILEQFVHGALHSHTAFIAGGEIVWHDFVDEFCEVYPYQVDRSSYPSQLSPRTRVDVQAAMTRLVRKLGLADGLLHTQFMASKDEFWIIECMRRCPGDLYGHHFKIALGFDYESQYVASFVGRVPIGPKRVLEAGKKVERRVVSTSEPRAFFGISCETGRRVSFIPLKHSGDRLEAAPFDKAGIIFIESSEEDGALQQPQTHTMTYD